MVMLVLKIFYDLIMLVQEKVYDKFGVKLKCEVDLVNWEVKYEKKQKEMYDDYKRNPVRSILKEKKARRRRKRD